MCGRFALSSPFAFFVSFFGLAPQMLHAASQASPRSVYVCGNTTSTTGLTVGPSVFRPSTVCFDSGVARLTMLRAWQTRRSVCCILCFVRVRGMKPFYHTAVPQTGIERNCCLFFCKVVKHCCTPIRNGVLWHSRTSLRRTRMQTCQQVTLSKEGTSGEVGLEAGALVLSDQVRVGMAFLCVCGRLFACRRDGAVAS